MPTVAKSDLLPRSEFKFLSLDVDGVFDLPSDWYLRICGLASCALKDGHHVEEELPRKKLLVDYWHTRPKALVAADEGAAGPSSSVPSGSDAPGSSQVAQAFATVPEQNDEEQPPPPYSLTSPDINATPVASVAEASSAAPTPSSAEPASTSDAGSDYLAQLTSTLGSVSLSEQTSTEPLRTSSPPATASGQPQQSNSGYTPPGWYLHPVVPDESFMYP